MKKIIVIFLFVFCAVSLSAQQFGLRGGVILDASSIQFPQVETNKRVGFNVGGVCDFKLPMIGWEINTGLLYANRGFSLKSRYGDGNGITYHFTTNNIEVPVSIRKEFDLFIVKPFIQAGLYASYTFSGRVKDGDSSQSMAFDGNANKLDIGANITMGFKLTSKLRFLANYGIGFAENKYVFSDQSISHKSRAYNLSLEYMF